MKENIIKSKMNPSTFSVSLPPKISNAVKIYCETIEIEPKEFITDAIVKDLIRTHAELKSEEFIYMATKVPEVKKPFKKSHVKNHLKFCF